MGVDRWGPANAAQARTFKTLYTPSSPLWARPHNTGLPTKTARAPSASACTQHDAEKVQSERSGVVTSDRRRCTEGLHGAFIDRMNGPS